MRVVLGVVVSVLGILLQGASAAGVSLWASLKGSILENTLESRFGEVWGLRALDWMVLGGLLAAAMALVRSTGRARRACGARHRRAHHAAALAPRPARDRRGLPGDHPGASRSREHPEPGGVFFPSDVLHVLAASVWVGGIACLLLALPAATRQLEGPERSRAAARNAGALLSPRARRR